MPDQISVHFFTQLSLTVNNRLFEPTPGKSYYYTEPFSIFRSTLEQDYGYAVTTSDLISPDATDVLVCVDLPKYRKDLTRLLSQYPTTTRLVLIVMESPVGHTEMFTLGNFDYFHRVVTYDPRHVGRPGIHHYFLPVLPEDIEDWQRRYRQDNTHFDHRRLLLIINANKYQGPTRIQNWPLLTALRGWKIDPILALSILFRENYSKRRKLARAAERDPACTTDIFGLGWTGERRAWWHAITGVNPFQAAQGKWKGSKLGLMGGYRFTLAFENVTASLGYISEKVFHPMLAGSVPVYLGDENIDKVVSPGAFVDARQFKSHSDLVKHLKEMTYDEWNHYRHAAQEFLGSLNARQFTGRAMANTLASAIEDRSGIEKTFNDTANDSR